MRVVRLCDPLTIAAVSGAAAAAVGGLSAVSSGMTASAQAEAQEAAAKMQQQRDLRDIRDVEMADAAKIRALLSTQGGEVSGAQGQALLAANAATAARNRTRVLQDTAAGVSIARSNRAAGQTSAILGGLGGAAGATSAWFGTKARGRT